MKIIDEKAIITEVMKQEDILIVALKFENKDLGIALMGLDINRKCKILIRVGNEIKVTGILTNQTKILKDGKEVTKWYLKEEEYFPINGEEIEEEMGIVLDVRDTGKYIEAIIQCQNIGRVLIDDKKFALTNQIFRKGASLSLTGSLVDTTENEKQFVLSHYRWL